jgi:hypothetical protein
MAYVQSVIVFFALLEGVALLNAIVLFGVRHVWVNVIAVAAIVALALNSLPNEAERDAVVR